MDITSHEAKLILARRKQAEVFPAPVVVDTFNDPILGILSIGQDPNGTYYVFDGTTGEVFGDNYSSLQEIKDDSALPELTEEQYVQQLSREYMDEYQSHLDWENERRLDRGW